MKNYLKYTDGFWWLLFGLATWNLVFGIWSLADGELVGWGQIAAAVIIAALLVFKIRWGISDHQFWKTQLVFWTEQAPIWARYYEDLEHHTPEMQRVIIENYMLSLDRLAEAKKQMKKYEPENEEVAA